MCMKKVFCFFMTVTKTDGVLPPSIDLLVAYKTLCNFVKDVNFAFGDHLPSIQLYAHLLDKTGLMNEEPIKKHVLVFYDFVVTNEEAICQQSVGLLQSHHVLKYSDKVYIDLNDVIQLAEKEDLTTIWTHLLTLLALFKPSSEARTILKKQREALTVSSPPPTGRVIESEDPPTAQQTNPLEGFGNMFQTMMNMMSQMNPPSSSSTSSGDVGSGGQGMDMNSLSGMMNMLSGSLQETLGNQSEGGDGSPPDPFEMMSKMMTSPVVTNMMKNLNDGSIDMPKIVDGMKKTLDTLQNVLSEVNTTSSTTEPSPPSPQPPDVE